MRIKHYRSILPVAFSTSLCSYFLPIKRTSGEFIPCYILLPGISRIFWDPSSHHLRAFGVSIWCLQHGGAEDFVPLIFLIWEHIGVMWGITKALRLLLQLSLLEAFSLPVLFYLLGFPYSLVAALTLSPICETFKIVTFQNEIIFLCMTSDSEFLLFIPCRLSCPCCWPVLLDWWRLSISMCLVTLCFSRALRCWLPYWGLMCFQQHSESWVHCSREDSDPLSSAPKRCLVSLVIPHITGNWTADSVHGYLQCNYRDKSRVGSP